MINIKKFSWIAALGLVMATSSCTDLDEKVYDRIDASTFYKNEASIIRKTKCSTIAKRNVYKINFCLQNQAILKIIAKHTSFVKK